MADILFKCSECGKDLLADQSEAGSSKQCVECNRSALVPRPEVSVACPHCQEPFEVAEVLLGVNARCPICQKRIQIAVRTQESRAEGRPVSLKERAALAAEPSAAGRFCPDCGAPMKPFSAICDTCGLNLTSGKKSGAKLALVEILRSPFHGDLPAEALWVLMRMFGWGVLVFVTAVANVLMGSSLIRFLEFNFPSLVGFLSGFAFGYLFEFLRWVLTVGITVWVALRACGWYAQHSLAIAEQYETGAVIAETERSQMESLKLAVLVTLIGLGPLLLGLLAVAPPPAIEPAQSLLPEWLRLFVKVLLLILGIPWAILYWPMATAMSGAYGTVSPVRVLRKISESFGGYLLLLLYLVPFFAATLLVMEFVINLMTYLSLVLVGVLARVQAVGIEPFITETVEAGLRPSFHQLLQIGYGELTSLAACLLFAALVGVIMAQYFVLAEFAMAGTLLRKYRHRQSLSGSEILHSLTRIALTAMVAVGMLAVRVSPFWDYLPITVHQAVTRAKQLQLDVMENKTEKVSPTTHQVAAIVSLIPSFNAAPLPSDDGFEGEEDTVLTVQAPGVLGNDRDVNKGERLTALVAVPPTQAAGFLLEADGSFLYMPKPDFSGTDRFTYRVHDGMLESKEATVTITIHPGNDPPVGTAESYATEEDTILTVGAPGVLANDTDPDAEDRLKAMIVNKPVNALSFTLRPDGSFSYMPKLNFHGTDRFTYKANDGTVDSKNVVVAITVSAVNDPPFAVNDNYVTDEDTALDRSAPAVLGNDGDPDGGEQFAAVLIEPPPHAASFALQPDGSFAYTPKPDFSGTDHFIYKTTDGKADSRPATVTIVVNPVNDPPVVAHDSYATEEDAPLEIAAAGILENDTDPDPGDRLTATLVKGPNHAASFEWKPDGSFHYTPKQDYNGADSFTYKVNDGQVDSAVATVTIKVSPINDPPVAAADSYSVEEDTALTVPAAGVLRNDTDVDAGDKLTASLVNGPARAASFKLNADGSFSYTPKPDFNGADQFTYKANDGQEDSKVTVVALVVNAINDPPVAADDGFVMDEGTTLAVPPRGVLGNDHDVDEGNALTAVLVARPANAESFTLNRDGSFTYKPKANFQGADRFTYEANDGQADSAVATVTITVKPTKD